MKVLFYLCLITFISASCDRKNESINKFDDKNIVEIYDLKDKRDTQGLLPFLKHENSNYRREAVLAFGSVQDSLALAELHDLINDSDEKIRLATAFSIGQTSSTSSQKSIQKQLKKEDNEKVINELLIAYGNCVDSLGLPFLVNYKANSDLAKQGKAWGLYRSGLKNIWSVNGTNQCLNLLRLPDPETQLAASNYFSRIKINHIEEYEEALINLFNSSNIPKVKMNLARALGKIDSEFAQMTLVNALEKEPNHLVMVNIIRALNEKYESKYFDDVKKLMVYGTSQVASSAANKLANSALLDELQVETLIAETKNNRVKAALYNKLIKLKGQMVSKTIIEEIEASNDITYKGDLLKALANDTAQVDYIADLIFSSTEAYFKTAGINALQFLLNTGYTDKSKMAMYFKKAVLSQDIGLIYGATLALSDTTNGLKNQFKTYDFLYEAKQNLTLPIDAEAMIAIQDLINIYEGSTASTSFNNPYNNPIEWEQVKSIPKNQQVILHTDKGDITWQLNVEEAPGTVDFFLRLARKGFYDGLTFHRVIPNFVAQGGCPRGDGFGGTPESIRSEFGLTRYKTGSVGVASAGKDTESCQFFMTHSPTPHLNGSYTIFAEVIEGMNVAQMLDLGDKINSIEIL